MLHLSMFLTFFLFFHVQSAHGLHSRNSGRVVRDYGGFLKSLDFSNFPSSLSSPGSECQAAGISFERSSLLATVRRRGRRSSRKFSDDFPCDCGGFHGLGFSGLSFSRLTHARSSDLPHRSFGLCFRATARRVKLSSFFIGVLPHEGFGV